MEKLENDGGNMPPARDRWLDAPGTLVMKFERSVADTYSEYAPLEFQVRELTPGVHFTTTGDAPVEKHYEASTPYRSCFYQGKSVEEAIAALMKGFCLQSREGTLNPNTPHKPGAPIIQHAIHVLTERLLWNVELRQENLLLSGYAQNPESIAKPVLTADDLPGPKDLTEQMVRAVARDNEIVAALATAIAALARVKDL